MSSLPYVTAPGNVARALEGIRKAATPERVTGDFVKTILKIPGGSGDQITSFLKKIGFANTDGTPTDLYTKFRNPSTSGAAVARAIRTAYAPLYKHNEYMHELSENELVGLIMEETGKAHDEAAVGLIASAIGALKKYADFSGTSQNPPDPHQSELVSVPSSHNFKQTEPPSTSGIGFNLGYTINLNLPATSDIAVFNAIFKSLKENLLRPDDV